MAPNPPTATDDHCDTEAAEQDLRAAIAEWRGHMLSASSLADPIDSTRDHVLGDPAATFVIVEYGDYQCSECAQAHSLREQIRPWVADGRVCLVFRHFPLIDAHPRALRAAQAIEAAADQGRFAEMHDHLMTSATVTDEDGQEHLVLDANLSDDGLLNAVRHLGLDLDRFQTAMDDPGTIGRIMRDFLSGVRSGVNGTPTFYLGGERQDVIGPEELIARLDTALAAR